MLRLSHLTLSHFRSHKRAEISLDDRPITLFGSNGAGKTNILEAISMLSPGRGLRRAKIDEMARMPESVGWKINAELHSLGQVHEIETRFTGEGSRSVLIDGKTAPQIALARIARIVWLVPVMDRLWVEGAEGRRRFLDRLALSFEPKHAEVSLIYDKAMRERNRMLKDNITDPAWYGAVESQMAAAGSVIEQNRIATLDRIKASQDGAETSFPSAQMRLVDRDGNDPIVAQDDLKTAYSEGRSRDLAAGRTLAGPHRDDLEAIYTTKGTAAKLCSTGEQKALLVSLILSNARALAQDFGAPPLLLLDEVAAHLDADRQRALYDEICALGAQAWMTGTGADLFEALGDRAAHYYVDPENGISEYKMNA